MGRPPFPNSATMSGSWEGRTSITTSSQLPLLEAGVRNTLPWLLSILTLANGSSPGPSNAMMAAPPQGANIRLRWNVRARPGTAQACHAHVPQNEQPGSPHPGSSRLPMIRPARDRRRGAPCVLASYAAQDFAGSHMRPDCRHGLPARSCGSPWGFRRSRRPFWLLESRACGLQVMHGALPGAVALPVRASLSSRHHHASSERSVSTVSQFVR